MWHGFRKVKLLDRVLFGHSLSEEIFRWDSVTRWCSCGFPSFLGEGSDDQSVGRRCLRSTCIDITMRFTFLPSQST